MTYFRFNNLLVSHTFSLLSLFRMLFFFQFYFYLHRYVFLAMQTRPPPSKFSTSFLFLFYTVLFCYCLFLCWGGCCPCYNTPCTKRSPEKNANVYYWGERTHHYYYSPFFCNNIFYLKVVYICFVTFRFFSVAAYANLKLWRNSLYCLREDLVKILLFIICCWEFVLLTLMFFFVCLSYKIFFFVSHVTAHCLLLLAAECWYCFA